MTTLQQRIRSAANGRFGRDVVGSVGVSFIALGLGGLQSILIARRFGPSGKGVIAIVMLLSATLSPVLASGFAASCVYFASRAPVRDTVRNATTYAAIASIVGLAVVAVMGATGALHRIAPSLRSGYLVVAVVCLPLAISQSLFSGLLMGLGRIQRVNGIRVAQAIASLIIVTSAVLAHRGTLFIVGGLVVVSLLVTTMQVSSLQTSGAEFRLGWSRPLIGEQAKYAAKDHVGAIATYMNHRLDQVFVSAFVGAAGVGLYSVTTTVGELLWVLPDALSNVVFSRSSNERHDESRGATLKIAIGMLGVGIVGALALAIVGRPLIQLLYSERFDRSYTALLWVLPGAAVFSPTKVLTADIAGRGHPGVNSAAAGLAVPVAVALDAVLIPKWGINGAAAASSITYLVVASSVAIAFWRLGSAATVEAGA